MRTIFALALISTVLNAAPQTTPAAGAYSLDQVFAKLDEAGKTFKSVDTNIERTKVTVLVNDTDRSSGKLYFMRRGKMPRLKLEMSKPAPDYLLVDNGKLQHYVPNVKQVQEKNLAGNESRGLDMIMALGFGQTSADLKANFDVTLAGEETVDGKKTTILDLKPKSGAMFKSVRMWLDQQKWVAVQVKVIEASGDPTTFKYTGMKLNGNIPDSRFKLSMPKDVKVIKL